MRACEAEVHAGAVRMENGAMERKGNNGQQKRCGVKKVEEYMRNGKNNENSKQNGVEKRMGSWFGIQ